MTAAHWTGCGSGAGRPLPSRPGHDPRPRPPQTRGTCGQASCWPRDEMCQQSNSAGRPSCRRTPDRLDQWEKVREDDAVHCLLGRQLWLCARSSCPCPFLRRHLHPHPVPVLAARRHPQLSHVFHAKGSICACLTINCKDYFSFIVV